MKFQKSILIGAFVVFCSSVIIFPDSFSQKNDTIQDFLVLQTGIFSTENNDFAISNIFQTRVYQDGKIMRISGITTTGEVYYLIQKIDDDISIVNGKILIDGVFVPIINKNVVVEQEIQTAHETKLNMVVKLSKYTYSNYPFTITVRVFDAEKNPHGKFEETLGALENVFVNATITNRFGKFITSISGYTDSSGLFRGSYLVNERIAGEGEYNVNVIIDDGVTSTNQSFTTFFRADIRHYFADNNP